MKECPDCGYTEKDRELQGDHRLCKNYPFFESEKSPESLGATPESYWEKRGKFKVGERCEHGRLARQCEVCAMIQTEIDLGDAEEKIESLQAELINIKKNAEQRITERLESILAMHCMDSRKEAFHDLFSSIHALREDIRKGEYE